MVASRPPSEPKARKWKTSAWRPKPRFTGTGLSKFQLSPAPTALPHSRTKLQSRDVAVASVPPGSFLRAYGSKDGGSEATATVSWTIAWERLYPVLNQWIPSFSHSNLKMKFQLSSPPAALPHSRKKLRLSPATSIDNGGSVVGRALLRVDDSDGQECPSYEDHCCVNWRLLNDLLVNEVSA